jgi:hypothetical protein
LTFLSNVVAYPCRHSPRDSASWLIKAFRQRASSRPEGGRFTATTPRTPSCWSARTTCDGATFASPDDGDALALTIAYPVAKRDWAEERRFEEGLQKLKRWVV